MKKKKFLAIRIDAELHHKLKLIALMNKITVQEFIENLITESLNGS